MKTWKRAEKDVARLYRRTGVDPDANRYTAEARGGERNVGDIEHGPDAALRTIDQVKAATGGSTISVWAAYRQAEDVAPDRHLPLVWIYRGRGRGRSPDRVVATTPAWWHELAEVIVPVPYHRVTHQAVGFWVAWDRNRDLRADRDELVATEVPKRGPGRPESLVALAWEHDGPDVGDVFALIGG